MAIQKVWAWFWPQPYLFPTDKGQCLTSFWGIDTIVGMSLPHPSIHVLVGIRDGALLVVCAWYVAFMSIGAKVELVMYKSTDTDHKKYFSDLCFMTLIQKLLIINFFHCLQLISIAYC